MKGKRKQQKLRQEQLEEEKKELEETSSDKTDPENSELKVKEESEEDPRPKEIWEKFKKEEPPKRKKSGLTGFAIKMIACLSMLFDHIAAVFLDEGYFFLHPDVDKAPDWIFHMDFAMRAFGRLAFPLFCFLIVEGCFHTGNKWKYLRNLIVFGIISEIPFDLAFNRSFFDWSSQNVYFTLALGLLTIIGIEYFTKGSFMKAGPKEKLAVIFIVTATAVLASLMRADYAFLGILVVLFMYIYRKNKGIAAGGLVFMFVLVDPLELISMVDFAILPLYNGERGRKIKYAFYLFYPLHILILYVIRKLTMGI